MTAAIIGVSGGILTILLFLILRGFDRKIIFGLILSGIGFLYVGFVWTRQQDLIINSVQAIFFVFIAYYGVHKNLTVLAAGFFLHGIWDISYPFFRDLSLIPPDYDIFCLAIDFVLGAYVLLFRKHFQPALPKG